MRPAELDSYFLPLRHFKGVGDKIALLLQSLLRREQPNVKDLLMHLPVDAVDRRLVREVSAEMEGQLVTLQLTIGKHYPSNPRFRRAPYRVACENAQLSLMLVFFNARGNYLKEQLPEGQVRLISGKLEQGKQGWQIIHPQLIAKPEEEAQVVKPEPVYPLTAGLHHRKLLDLMAQACEQAAELPEWQDAAWRKTKSWESFHHSLTRLHQLQLREDISTASLYFQRLIYDELLASQLALAIVRLRMRQNGRAPVIKTHPVTPAQAGVLSANDTPAVSQDSCLRRNDDLLKALRDSLPFTLTDGQNAVLHEILQDMQSGQRMLRLLQGDVGSGKTIVALLAMLAVVQSGGQAALMVPTEILGRQHFAAFQKLLEPLGIPVAFLGGSLDNAQRAQVMAQLESGELPLVIGTHAVFQEKVKFQNLMLAVVDEQHRFGVNQRLKLTEKGQGTHLLLMSATPIPRSLTMTMFGDMDVSILSEKPAGRQEITTRALLLSRYEQVMQSVSQALARGEKIYWICPLVEGSEEMETDLAAATERHREFSQRFGSITNVTLVHGRIKGGEREIEMQRFASGESRLLVATTVVEVGVDVPDATIIVIEHAERFGLAQLHQLRGRVGRGDKPSSCLLLYADKVGETSRERLKAMRESNDGFFLAEEDLRLRGSGEILGTRQSGLPSFHFAELPRDQELLKAARDEVKLILHHDAELTSERGKALRMLLYLFGQDEKLRYLKG
jgi:ATP-dependent DNA helicase RecG